MKVAVETRAPVALALVPVAARPGDARPREMPFTLSATESSMKAHSKQVKYAPEFVAGRPLVG
jgi:hypothetical protein